MSQAFLEKIRKKSGYLPYQHLKLAYQEGIIFSKEKIQPSQFQPVSLDLRLGDKAYRIQSSFLPENETVEQKLKDLKLYEVDLRARGNNAGILEKGAIYLIPLKEELKLPPTVYAYANPKSSTGRLDMFTRVIVDRGHRFDEIPRGYKGKLYLEVISKSFPVKVKENLCLNQLRIVQTTSVTFGKQSLEPDYKKYPILFDRNGFEVRFKDINFQGGVFVSVDLMGSGNDSIVAYKAKTNSSVIDLSKTNYYDPQDFWEPVRLNSKRKRRLVLEPDTFYIMMSREKICIWPQMLAEMIAYEPNSGELRTHYAGFFDPGFGWNGSDDNMNQGAHAVMEVRPHHVPFMVEHGQTFCRLKFEKILEKPEKVYGRKLSSHYQSQELKLSKYFKD